jgi:hypothetical protein
MSTSASQCEPVFATRFLPGSEPAVSSVPCPAKRLAPQQRQDLAIQVLAGTETVCDLARQDDVSRKFLYQQAHTVQQALDGAFAPSQPRDDVLFCLPVTKAWLEQLVLGLTLTCHSSYRGVVELLGDLFEVTYKCALALSWGAVRLWCPRSCRCRFGLMVPAAS